MLKLPLTLESSPPSLFLNKLNLIHWTHGLWGNWGSNCPNKLCLRREGAIDTNPRHFCGMLEGRGSFLKGQFWIAKGWHAPMFILQFSLRLIYDLCEKCSCTCEVCVCYKIGLSESGIPFLLEVLENTAAQTPVLLSCSSRTPANSRAHSLLSHLSCFRDNWDMTCVPSNTGTAECTL